MQVLLDQSKKYFKANLHCHSTNSDGRATPEDIKREYKARGYSIVAYTDHDHIVDMSYLNDENFLTITSAEFSVWDSEHLVWNADTRGDIPVTHFNLYAKDPHNDVTPFMDAEHDVKCPEDLRPLIKYYGLHERSYTPEWICDMVNKAHRLGYLVSYNHPNWSLENAVSYMKYDGFDFIEIHNTGCVKSGHVNDERVFDDMLIGGKKIFCTAADDNHNIHGFEHPRSDSFGGWVMINAERLEYGEIIGALERGEFYASTGGPEILSLTRDGNSVTVVTTGAYRVIMRTGGRRCGVKYAENGELLKSVSFKLHPNDHIFRLRVEDEYGKCSYTQAYEVEPFQPA